MNDSKPSDPSAAPTSTPPKQSVLAQACGVAGGIVGFVFGKYCWQTMIVPGITAGITLFVLSKILPKEKKPIAAAFSLQLGQIVWMTVGLLFGASLGVELPRGEAMALGIEIMIYLLALVALAAVPSWITAGILIAYHLIGLVTQVMMLQDQVPNTIMHKAVVTHIGIRVASIICLAVAVHTINKERRAELDADDEADDNLRLPT